MRHCKGVLLPFYYQECSDYYTPVSLHESAMYIDADKNSTSSISWIITTLDLRQWIQKDSEGKKEGRQAGSSQAEQDRRGGSTLKGYNREQGYYGWWQGEYVLFASEADYREAMEEE